jgi:triosephosphate isomerase (TIM)
MKIKKRLTGTVAQAAYERPRPVFNGMQMSPLIIGNWKLNPQKLSDALNLVQSVVKGIKGKDVLVAVAPPFIYLTEVRKKLTKSNVFLAAQNVSTEPMGAFTGEISAAQLRDLGVEYVTIGHSERRAMGETDSQVNQKIAIALKNKLTPIVCIGERERDENGKFFSFVESQIRTIAGALNSSDIKKVVIAYEPIWAIGTGVNATPEDVKEMQLFIFSILAKIYDRPTAAKVRLIYGGSVKVHNAKQIYVEGGMSGFLVGGSSLKAADFVEIIKATS